MQGVYNQSSLTWNRRENHNSKQQIKSLSRSGEFFDFGFESIKNTTARLIAFSLCKTVVARIGRQLQPMKKSEKPIYLTITSLFDVLIFELLK